MGVYIPNIEKPKSCFDCFAYDGEFMECRATGECVNETFYDKVRDDCPLIEIVRCKDCKYYDTESRSFPCCTDIFGAVRYMEADGFCSKGERRADEHTDKRD